MASFASSATTCGARKHAWTNSLSVALTRNSKEFSEQQKRNEVKTKEYEKKLNELSSFKLKKLNEEREIKLKQRKEAKKEKRKALEETKVNKQDSEASNDHECNEEFKVNVPVSNIFDKLNMSYSNLSI